MAFGSPGLSTLTDDEIKGLLAAMHRGHLVYPIRLADLIGGGFPHIAEKAEIVSGLDERGLRALLVSVMAERRGC
ncbi:MAG: hypothetical protein JRH11_01025 [Deltaproteobacteria bacterium]|nr:hypothetical protein [Deltaproteobacteria bacterium]